MWNVMGLVLTFLHQAPFWDDDEFNANLSASGNFVLDDHDYWWIQPLIFGVQAVQAEAYHMEGYQQTLHFDKFQSQMHKIVFKRQMVHEVDQWREGKQRREEEKQHLKNYIDQVDEWFDRENQQMTSDSKQASLQSNSDNEKFKSEASQAFCEYMENLKKCCQDTDVPLTDKEEKLTQSNDEEA